MKREATISSSKGLVSLEKKLYRDNILKTFLKLQRFIQPLILVHLLIKRCGIKSWLMSSGSDVFCDACGLGKRKRRSFKKSNSLFCAIGELQETKIIKVKCLENQTMVPVSRSMIFYNKNLTLLQKYI